MSKKRNKQKGSILAVALVFGTFFIIVFTGLLGYVGSQRHLSVKKAQREEAFNIAEAGLDLYSWHIGTELNGRTAAQTQAYWDGDPLGVPEYEREYRDPQGRAIGRFRLEVVPPEEGSTIVEVKSTGWHYDNPEVKRTLQARYRKPAWSEYVVLANDVMRFGEGTETWGPIHSNDGIRFDGVAHNLVTSSRETYWDPDTGRTKPGVWTSQPNPDEVFLSGNQFPVASVDFGGIIGNFAEIKQNAEADGIYLPTVRFLGDGYHLIIKTNGTVDIYRVILRGSPSHRIYLEIFENNRPIPENGVIFVEDNVTVEGTLNDDQLTIACADLKHGSNQYSIYIENDVKYASYDGTEMLGLIAQGDIDIGLYSEDDLRIDAALIAQSGRVGRDYYTQWESSQYYKRDRITVNGAIATNQRYGFSWSCGEDEYCSGYENRVIIFDPAFLYGTPPFFPTQNEYELDMWEEIN